MSKIKNTDLPYGEHEQIIKHLQNKDIFAVLDAVENTWKGSFFRFKLIRGSLEQRDSLNLWTSN